MSRQASVIMVNEIKTKMQEQVNWDKIDYKELQYQRNDNSKKRKQLEKKNKKIEDYYKYNYNEQAIVEKYFSDNVQDNHIALATQGIDRFLANVLKFASFSVNS